MKNEDQHVLDKHAILHDAKLTRWLTKLELAARELEDNAVSVRHASYAHQPTAHLVAAGSALSRSIKVALAIFSEMP